MNRSPLDLSLEDLDAAAKAASHRADRAARRAQVRVAGLSAAEPAPVIRLSEAGRKPRPADLKPAAGKRARRA
jgi:hypothetical protein